MKKKMNAVEAQPIVQESRVEKVATQPVVATQFAMPAHPILKESGEQPGAGKLFGYIRVSSREQNEARQVVALHNFGITDDHIFLDKQSGKDFNRPAYQALLRQLNEPSVWSHPKVSYDYLVSDGRNKYSVPYDLIGQTVDQRLTRNLVEVYYHGARVAVHVRLAAAQRDLVVKPEHMPEVHRKYLGYNEHEWM